MLKVYHVVNKWTVIRKQIDQRIKVSDFERVQNGRVQLKDHFLVKNNLFLNRNTLWIDDNVTIVDVSWKQKNVSC